MTRRSKLIHSCSSCRALMLGLILVSGCGPQVSREELGQLICDPVEIETHEDIEMVLTRAAPQGVDRGVPESAEPENAGSSPAPAPQ